MDTQTKSTTTVPPAPLTPARARSVTPRALLLGMALMPVNAYWIVMMENIRYSAHPTTISLFFNCVFILVVLTGLNGLIARVRPRWAFAQGELLLVYAMLCIGSCMAGHDFIQMLVPNLTWPLAQSNTSNNYLPLFGRYLPQWAMVPGIDKRSAFYLGHGHFDGAALHAWLPAILIWTGFVVLLLWTMQCINVLIRKQWTDNERLTYPLTKIPLEITDAQPFGRGRSTVPLTRSRLFWLGSGLAAALDTTNALNYYYPGVPAILPSNVVDLGASFTTKPFHAIGWTPLTYYPFMIGLGLLMPLDFLFSSWFFYIFWKLQAVVVVANAWDADPRMPYVNYQAFGAYLLFFVGTLWISRHYFGHVVARALALAITRMRAELGTPVHDLHFTGPDWALSDVLGTQGMAPGGMAAFSLFFWFNRAYRCHPMPFQLEAFKMAEQTGARREMRGWFWALLLAGGFGMLCAFWALLYNDYLYGMKWSDTSGWDRYTGWLKAPRPANTSAIFAIVVGFLFAAFLQAMRVRFFWWPFHPLAYAVSGSWEMNLLWMPLFIAWLTKVLLLRYGGMRTFTGALPFFYGLILGQFIPGSLLNIWGIVTNNPTYQFWQ